MTTLPEPSLSPEDIRRFKLDGFPQTDRDLSKWIFDLTGFNTRDRLHSYTDWLWFNTSLSRGFGLGLDDASDAHKTRQLRMLSLMDHALSGVHRFAGMPHMNEVLADTTVAHSKQVMRLIQKIFHQALGPSLSPGMQKLKRDAMLGAWVHDMGEIVMELTTADDIFLMNAGERTEVGHLKDHFERDLFTFSCELANYQIDHPAQSSLFIDTIESMRREAQIIFKVGHAKNQPRIETIRECITHMRSRMAAVRDDLALPAEAGRETRELLDIYDQAEKAELGGFLHPLVKTIESAEGQRYLQRNADAGGAEMSLSLATSTQVVESIRRIERRLPMLVSRATTPELRKLAIATCDLVYETVQRGCKPNARERVSLWPAIVDRQPDLREQPDTSHLKPTSIAIVRQQWHELMAERKAAQPAGCNARYYTLEEIDALYGAARAGLNQYRPVLPTLECLLHQKDDSHRIPIAVQELMRNPPRTSGVVQPFGGRPR